MKSLEDLKKLFPVIIELVQNNEHLIGDSCIERDEDGWGRCDDYIENYFTYEEDGWCIEISYRCSGECDSDPGDYWNPPYCELIRAWGEVTEITASHYDENTEEKSEFSEEDLSELRKEIDKVLENIA